MGPGAVILRPPRGGTASDVAPRVCGFQAANDEPRGPMLEQPLKFFVVFFVVVEPISLIPLFSGLTRGATRGIPATHGGEGRLGRRAHHRALRLGRGAVSRDDGHQPRRRSGSSAACCSSCWRSRWYSRASRAAAPRATSGRRAAGAQTSPSSRWPSPSSPVPERSPPCSFGSGRCTSPRQPEVFLILLAAVAAVLAITLVLMLLAEPLMRLMGVTGVNVYRAAPWRDTGRTGRAVRDRWAARGVPGETRLT